MLLFISVSLSLFFSLLLSISKDPLRKCLFLPQLTLSLSDGHIELSRDEMPRQAKHTFNSNIAKIKLLCLPIGGPPCVCFGCLERWMGSLTWMLLGTCDSHIRPMGRAQWDLWDRSLWHHAGWSGWMSTISPCLGSPAGFKRLSVASFHQATSPRESKCCQPSWGLEQVGKDEGEKYHMAPLAFMSRTWLAMHVLIKYLISLSSSGWVRWLWRLMSMFSNIRVKSR